MERVLVTGFEPFGDWARNPSAELAGVLDGWSPAEGWTVVGRSLPVDLSGLEGTLDRARRESDPAVVIHVGLAGSASQIAVERIGINVADFPMADNAARMAQDEPLVPGAPAAYLSTLPVRAIVRDLQEVGIPAAVSNSAGTYLCNAALYLSLHAAAQDGDGVQQVGFIHVPPIPEQVVGRRGAPSMPFDVLLDALRRAVRVSSRGVER